MGMTDREAAFRRAALLVKELGSSPWRDWDFTLRLADWLIASDSAPGPAPVPHPDQPPWALGEQTICRAVLDIFAATYDAVLDKGEQP